MSAPPAAASSTLSSRSRSLQLLGIFSGLTAGAWLGAAEAPTKLVTLGLSPMVISLVMVVGVFLARWSLPALILGSSSISADARRAPHLILWAILAGCLWAVANTLTVYAIRDIGLSIAFPLWNSNSLLGILWGFLFFNELRGAGLSRWLGVIGGTLIMCIGAAILAIASSGTHAPGINPTHGVLAALGAGVLWGTMYIPYRKAYLSGMNPLSFVTFFTIGELGMMSALSFGTLGAHNLFAQLSSARGVIFWLMLGGFIWVIGDLFQQYAAKYVGISRGIPLSNTNQLWGLLWGVLVFGELHGRSTTTYAQVIGGSLLMILGVGAISLSSASPKESAHWKAAALRESDRYALSPEFVEARMDGRQSSDETPPSRGLIDWLFVALATGVFIYFATLARVPNIPAHWTPAILLSIVSLILLVACGLRLWRTTKFQ